MVDRAKVQQLVERLREYTTTLREIAQGERDLFLADRIQTGAARYYLVAVAEGGTRKIVPSEQLDQGHVAGRIEPHQHRVVELPVGHAAA